MYICIYYVCPIRLIIIFPLKKPSALLWLQFKTAPGAEALQPGEGVPEAPAAHPREGGGHAEGALADVP